MRHRLGLATSTQISVCKSPFPSAGTTVSLFCAKTVQQRPLLPREVETWLPDCRVTHCTNHDSTGCQQCIVFKLVTVTYEARLSGLPSYLQHEIHDYRPSRTLRSTSALLLQQQPATISFAARVFCAAAPTVWNSLGVHTHSADTFLTFKNRLKLNSLNLATRNCFWRHRSAPESRFACELTCRAL